MDIGASFSFITSDRDWIKKIAIGALLAFTGIGIIAVTGWSVEIMRRLARNDPELLPDWNNFGQYALDGLKLGVIGFVWVLPLILIGACAGIAAAFMGGDLSSDAGGILSLLVLSCVGLLAVVYSLLLSFLLPAAAGLLADGGDFGQALNPANAFRLLRANPGGFVVAALLGGVAIGVLASVGAVFCGVGSFPAIAFGYAVQGHLWGQAYARAKGNPGPLMA
ncbi:MAG: DUF4013 domain-containing protein [Chloroflexi bacterium]|nr:DUF4013 domain-containing protein [Chloroflexota bacterium]